MTEQLIRWERIENLSGKHYIDSTVNNIDGFEIVLSDAGDENKKICVLFQNGVNVFRVVDESFYVRSITAIDKRYGGDFYRDWTLFKVLNSRYSEFLSERSNPAKSNEFIHFLFIGVNAILDVVATYEPKVELIRR